MIRIDTFIGRRTGTRASSNAHAGCAIAISQPPIAAGTALALLLALAPVCGAAAQDAPASPGSAETRSDADASISVDTAKDAIAVLDAMDAGDFAGVHARFDATMSAAVSVDQLGKVWQGLPAQVGAAKGRGEAKIETAGSLRIARIALYYEKAELQAIIGFANDGKISAFAIRPGEAPPAAASPAAYVAPPLPANAAFAERDLSVGDPAKALGATLAMPKGKGPFPAIVLVHGSGPQDRDETVGPNKTFLDIARGLAGRGVAVLRYDKRTKVRPQDYSDGGDVDRETTDDAVSALAVLRQQPNIDPKRIFVLGHSQGGMMAPRIATRSGEHGVPVAGVVLLAAPSRPLLDILVEQTRRMAVLDDGKTSAEESAAIAELSRRVAAVRRGGEVAPGDSPAGLPAAYWRSFEATDPVAEARALTQPMLILQGGNDIQVVDADWQGWKAAFHATPRVTFKLYDSLNHLAMPGTGTIGEYQTPGHVDDGLIADVATWIGQQRPHARKK